MSFGRLKALDNGKPKVKCKCSCGVVKDIKRNHFMAGNILSCGCLKKEKLAEINKSHGMTNTRLYSIWSNMKSRCYNKNKPDYCYYGAKGITVCDEWLTFEGFFNNIPLGYRYDLELDRIDNTKGYSKDNCKWSTRSEQCLNRNSIGDVPHRGISFIERDNLYRATITKNGKRQCKHFKRLEDAISWRKIKEEKLND